MKNKGLLVSIILAIFLIQCSQKKKEYVPLMGLVQDTTSSPSTSSSLSSVGDVTLVAGGSKSDIAQIPSTTETSTTPVVSVTGSVGTISSSSVEATANETTSSSSSSIPASSSDTSNSTASSVDSSSNNVDTTTNTTVSSSTSSSNSSSTTTENNTTETSSTNTTNAATNDSNTPAPSSNSLASVQPSVTVTMGSSTNTLVAVSGSVLDSKENTIGGAIVSLTGVNTNNENLSIYIGTSTASGFISGEFTIPAGISNLSLVLTISGNTSQSVTIPVSVTTACKEDNNRGHGNDADGIDEDNTGNSTGVNSNAMENRKSNDKKKDTCVAGTKYISKIGNINLPVQASQLAFLQEKSNLMAYLNGTDANHTLAVILIIFFAGLGLFLRKKFLTT